MGEVTVDKVTLDSALESRKILEAILEQEPVNIHYVTGGGNGAEVDLTLHPDVMEDELVEVLTSGRVQRRLNALGLEITELEEESR